MGMIGNAPYLGIVNGGNIADGSITASDMANRGSEFGYRNRIINGDMRIDQRSNGAAITPTAGQYTIDRFKLEVSQASKLTVQRVSSTAQGFSNALKVTVASVYTPTSSDFFLVRHFIEGFNSADLGFGSAAAKTITISFYVNASITGLYSVSVRNNGGSRAYVATFTVTSANADEYKTIVVPGDVTGTWAANSSIGIELAFDLGTGSTRSTATTNAWQSGDYFKATGSVSLVANAGATFYITGVQLEAGTAASPFERRDYGRELQMCQRYCLVYSFDVDGSFRFFGYNASSGSGVGQVYFPVQTRVKPTGISVSTPSAFTFYHGASASAVTNITFDNASNKTANVTISASGLTVGQGCILAGQAAGNKIEFTGMEL